jgi:opacity protein-like surface antigen
MASEFSTVPLNRRNPEEEDTMRRVVAFLFVAALAAAAPVSAQDKLVDVNIGGGYTAALSEESDHFGNGYNFNLGVTFNVTPIIGIQAEYSFNGLGEKQITLPVSPTPSGVVTDTPFFANMNMQYGSFNAIIKPPTEGMARPYLVAGVGVYYRPVKVTTPAVGYVPGYCDPWYYVCYPGGYVPVDKIVGSRSSTDFGMDVGGGVNFQVGEGTSIYVEARYHYIWGPEVTDPTTNVTKAANGQFFPITFGVRF